MSSERHQRLCIAESRSISDHSFSGSKFVSKVTALITDKDVKYLNGRKQRARVHVMRKLH